MGQRWLEERLWCLQLCETWPQCLGEGGTRRGCILLGMRPPFSGIRGLAKGMRWTETRPTGESLDTPLAKRSSRNSASV